MLEEYVVFNGVEVISGWPEKIIAAQTLTIYRIGGKSFERIRYGEDWGASRGPCHDCAVIIGQYHVPCCDMEKCPACGEQSISCGCRLDAIE